MGLVSLVRRPCEAATGGRREKAAIFEPSRGISPETDQVGTLILDLQPLEL